MSHFVTAGELNTSMVGTIEEFFPETQTATVKLHMQEFVQTDTRNYQMEELPSLVDVPVHFVQSGGFILTTPIAPGDDCLVFFTQIGIEHWLYRGENKFKVIGGRPEPAALTEYSMNDALCIVGLNNLVTNVPNFNMEGMELRNKEGDQRITLQADKAISLVTPTDVVVSCANANVTSTGNLLFKSEGDVTIESGGTLTLKATAIAMVKG